MTNIFTQLLSFFFIHGVSSQEALVTVTQGQLQGALVDLVTGDGTYYAFKGIPYVAAPLGDLRFKAPQPPSSWEGIRNATEFGDVCYQYSDIYSSVIDGSEDCLFLNVYTPNLTPTELLPVMVYIHGGDFKYGSGNSDFYGPDLLVRKDVIVVTFNYRLEIMGFLSLQNADVPGNAGLKDQVAALQWVQNNIEAFGGDASKVTLFGQSAGGVSVSLHLLSTLSAGLFNNAIIQSGAPTTGWAITPEPRERAFELGAILGLNTTDESELLTFLQSLPKEDLVNIKPNVTVWDTISDTSKLEYFGPVVESTSDGFLTMHPWEYVANDQVNNVDFIIGFNSEEGIIAVPVIATGLTNANTNEEFYLGSQIVYNTSITNEAYIAESIKSYFLGTANATLDSISQLVKLYSAIGYKYDTIKFADVLSAAISSSIYLYEFGAISDRNYFGSTIASAVGVTFDGVCHSDDVPYLFDMQGLGLTVDTSSDSFQIIETITSLWTNFAKYGNPTPDSSLGATWTAYSRTGQDYLSINSTLTASTKAYNTEYTFMDSVYSGIYP